MNLLKNYGKLKFRLNYYTNVSGLSHLMQAEEISEEIRLKGKEKSGFWKRYSKLNSAMSQLLEDYNRVSYSVCDIECKRSMAYLVGITDKANGFVYSVNFSLNQKEKQIDYQQIIEYMSFEGTEEAQEKYLDEEIYED